MKKTLTQHTCMKKVKPLGSFIKRTREDRKATMSSESERGKKNSYRRGNVVSPEPASDQSTMKNVIGFLQDYVPQAVSGPKDDKRERVLWVRFESCDINDASLGDGVRGNPLLLILGLANGFAVWTVTPGGDAREVYCVCGEGETTRVAKLLPTPQSYEGVTPDKFPEARPIMAVVKKGRHNSGSTVAYSTLQLLSLRTNGGDNTVKKFVFKTRPIVDVHCNRRVVVIVFQKRMVVLDAGSLDNKYVIRNSYPSVGYPCNPVALGTRWLAFSETKLSSKHQSVGGMSDATPPSVATTVLKNVKKGISALTDTISGLTGKTQSGSTESPEHTHQQTTDSTSANIITVLDTIKTHTQEFKVQELDRESGGVIAHFVAHTGPCVHIAALAFNSSGTLLVSASTEGNSFHVFHILPHPWLSSETAIHHIYTLYRGATSGVVQDICFSGDSRWVGVSTLNGTTHVFPLSPYGGEITVRTHTPRRVVNKMSRFHTTAGIGLPSQAVSSTGITAQTSRSSQSPPLENREIPSVAGGNGLTVMSNSWNNPRALPLPCPVVVNALQQIKQPYVSTSESVGGPMPTPPTSRGSDNGDPFVTLAGPETTCVRAVFWEGGDTLGKTWGRADSSNERAAYSLFVVGATGELTEHGLEPHKLTTAPDGEDAPIELTRTPKLCWKLLSFPVTGSMAVPLTKDNPLLENRSPAPSNQPRPQTNDQWLSQVEILTHAPPTRRLWMGPQFSFKSYQSPTPSPPSSNTMISTPSPPNTVIYTGSLNSPRGADSQRATLHPSSDNPLSDLLSEPKKQHHFLKHTSVKKQHHFFKKPSVKKTASFYKTHLCKKKQHHFFKTL
ncbi:BCAS3 microtubule associated cell migration factor-like isoform X1 [Halichondria panicea]|uniref:BCAS3 microtubule associated cell migration factor-like isoform X1 n=1 Tax=Halichondria panicea TaxID=6063 RepID=UPI00312B3F1B